MNLELIRTLGLKRPDGIKGLAKEVDMSHINLFRCIREGSIKAQDLERIAIALKVNILDFFPGFPDIPERNMDISIGNNSVSSFNGNNISLAASTSLEREIQDLRARIAQLEDHLRDKDEIIALLRRVSAQ